MSPSIYRNIYRKVHITGQWDCKCNTFLDVPPLLLFIYLLIFVMGKKWTCINSESCTKVHMLYMVSAMMQAKRKKKGEKKTHFSYLELSQCTMFIMVKDWSINYIMLAFSDKLLMKVNMIVFRIIQHLKRPPLSFFQYSLYIYILIGQPSNTFPISFHKRINSNRFLSPGCRIWTTLNREKSIGALALALGW